MKGWMLTLKATGVWMATGTRQPLCHTPEVGLDFTWEEPLPQLCSRLFLFKIIMMTEMHNHRSSISGFETGIHQQIIKVYFANNVSKRLS